MDFLDYLLKNKILKKDDAALIKEEEKTTSQTVDEIILSKKIAKEDDLFKAKSEFLKIPLKQDLPDKINSDILAVVPREAVDFYKMIPFAIDRQKASIEVGMVQPDNNQAQQALTFLARQQKLTAKVFLITPTSFQKYLAQYRSPENEMQRALKGLEETVGLDDDMTVDKKQFERLVEEAPVIKMVAVILRQAVEGGASDIHIEPTRKSSRVRYRLDGVLHSSLSLPAKIHPAIVARVKILSNLKIDETRVPQDGRFATMVGQERIDFRVSSFPTALGEKIAIRVLNPETGLKTMEKLGLHPKNLLIVQHAIKQPYGMILVTGPTGSGKSTTLYSVLRMLNKEGVNIVTLEDPVEYFMEGVNQSQVVPEIDYTFARGLRQILRQDPDIIMVGEIRDEETANLAVHAALTGHLVLSTLHTNSATGVVPRLTDMGIKPFLISPSLNLVISQRLLRVLCPVCKKKVKATGSAKKYISEKLRTLPAEIKSDIDFKNGFSIFQPQGCKKCNNKGYSGRVAVFEVLKITDALAEIINRSPTEQEIVKQAKAQGMITLEEDGILKVLDGVTSLEEVMKVSEA